jgi:hypothetical protein
MSSGLQADRQRAAASRDAAVVRSRRLTAIAFATAAVLTATFTALAAGATHARKFGRRAVVRTSHKSGPVVAPPAPLVSVQSPQAQAPPPAASPPVQAPATAPPVVVSGGS